MEYLQTPDSSARIFALPTPGNDRPADRPADRQALRSSFQSLFSPDTSCGGGSGDGGGSGGGGGGGMPPLTPAFGNPMAASASQQAYLHRQTPLHHQQHYSNAPQLYPGLTPFLGPVTPALAPGAQALPAHFGLPSGTHGGSAPETPAVEGTGATPSTAGHGLDTHRNSPQTSATTPAPAGAGLGQLTSPFLQAAAKEAVRREFMNMPSYIAAGGAADSSSTLLTSEHGHHLSPSVVPSQQTHKAAGSTEQTVPDNDHVAAKEKPNAVAATLARSVPAPQQGSGAMPQQPLTQALHPAHHQQMSMMPMMHYPYPPYPGMMYMPYHGMQTMQGVPSMPSMMMPPHKSDRDGCAESQVHDDTARHVHETQQQHRPDQTQQQMQGMVVMGPNGPMMIPAPGYAFPQQAHPQMLMPQLTGPHPTTERSASTAAVASALVATAPAQPESAARRKERVEQEKQDLIREFKKKTREAALVRFRQKRRERRFGKLIRYDCRKKLADARPRIKGRFVRVKDGEDDDPMSPEMEMDHEEIDSPAQVVPQY
jgi:hypothetical protein